MTVNERLAQAGLIAEFDEAIRAKDRDRAIAVLTRAELPREAAAATTDTLLANPKRYGY